MLLLVRVVWIANLNKSIEDWLSHLWLVDWLSKDRWAFSAIVEFLSIRPCDWDDPRTRGILVRLVKRFKCKCYSFWDMPTTKLGTQQFTINQNQSVWTWCHHICDNFHDRNSSFSKKSFQVRKLIWYLRQLANQYQQFNLLLAMEIGNWQPLKWQWMITSGSYTFLRGFSEMFIWLWQLILSVPSFCRCRYRAWIIRGCVVGRRPS